MTARRPSTTGQRGPEDVDAYLKSLPEDQRKALADIRRSVRSAAPAAEEALVYGVPGFKLGGKGLVCYAGFKHHCGFYPMSPMVIRIHAAELEAYRVSKGTIRFSAESPLPAALVKKLVRARAAELNKSGG